MRYFYACCTRSNISNKKISPSLLPTDFMFQPPTLIFLLDTKCNREMLLRLLVNFPPLDFDKNKMLEGKEKVAKPPKEYSELDC